MIPWTPINLLLIILCIRIVLNVRRKNRKTYAIKERVESIACAICKSRHNPDIIH
jgi:hypothetical protein